MCGLGLLLVIAAAPARAGHWVFHVTGTGSAVGSNGTAQDSAPAWTPPADNTTSITLPAYGHGYGATGGDTATTNVKVQANLTANWVGDTVFDMTPPPPSVMLIETSTASAIGSLDGVQQIGTCSDGIGDTVPDASNTVNGTHFVSQSGGTISIPLNLSANISVASTAPYWDGTPGQGGVYHPGQALCNASVGPVTIGIHAQPYNWQLVDEYTYNGNALHFDYSWSSTTGNVGDLQDCYLHEHLIWPGYGNPFNWPAPFYPGDPLPNPYNYPDTGQEGIAMTGGTKDDEYEYLSSLQPIFSGVTVNQTQEFEYDDLAIGTKNVQVPGSAFNTITRSISDHGTSGAFWWYNCTGAGYSVTCPLP